MLFIFCLVHSLEEEQQTHPPVTRRIAGAAPVRTASTSMVQPKYWGLTRASHQSRHISLGSLVGRAAESYSAGRRFESYLRDHYGVEKLVISPSS